MAEEKDTLTDQTSGEEVKATPEYTEGEAERLPEPESGIEAAVVDAVDASEKATDSGVVKGFDAAVTAVQDSIDSLDDDQHDVANHAEDFSDTVAIMGRSVTVPGGIYTVVFGALAVATLTEIILAELPRGFLTIPIMISLALVKSVLVVAYYMHLREDSRIFTLVLLLPAFVALIATLFLLAVPVGY